ncbi:MAG TPA: DegT/DnrJ/EryC1/StrS family aminotransferase, partial [Anaerolineae bacterium]|nr:DegT/DnrJ/EryC1/StrS family aminotransferase [Anaerolineae bacterium]
MTNNYFSSDGRLFYFWKGRVALYAILKALGVGPGDEIILPAFTCVVVPNAILYLGARPIYADIEPDSYNLSARTVEPLITARTRVILGQNTFGLSADLDPLMALARDYRLTMVEDCAHGLGGSYKGRPNGTVADAAFFSSQWSKPFSTGLGGVAYTANPALAQAIAPIAAAMSRPDLGQQAMLQGQLWLRPLANQPRLYYGLVGVYRYLTQTMGLSVGSSSQSELVSITQPAGYAQQ